MWVNTILANSVGDNAATMAAAGCKSQVQVSDSCMLATVGASCLNCRCDPWQNTWAATSGGGWMCANLRPCAFGPWYALEQPVAVSPPSSLPAPPSLLAAPPPASPPPSLTCSDLLKAEVARSMGGVAAAARRRLQTAATSPAAPPLAISSGEEEAGLGESAEAACIGRAWCGSWVDGWGLAFISLALALLLCLARIMLERRRKLSSSSSMSDLASAAAARATPPTPPPSPPELEMASPPPSAPLPPRLVYYLVLPAAGSAPHPQLLALAQQQQQAQLAQQQQQAQAAALAAQQQQAAQAAAAQTLGGAASSGLGSLGNSALSGQQAAPIDPALLAGQEQTVIPNLASYVVINSGLTLFTQQPQLKRIVPIAIDRAIREIISPVVERSVTISCVTTRELMLKDFAMEPDEQRMRKSAQLMVQNLAGSLALVTCKEPLRVACGNHMRSLMQQAAIEEP